MRALLGTAPCFRLPQPLGQSFGKSAADLVSRRRLPATAIAQPDTGGLPEANGYGKSRSGVECPCRDGSGDGNEFKEFAGPVADDPPDDCATTNCSGELCEGLPRPCHPITTCQG